MFSRRKYIAVLISGAMILSLMTGAILGMRTESYSERDELSTETDSLSSGPWPAFGRDRGNRGLSPYDSGHVDGTINWTYETDTWLWSSPAIGSEGMIYFGSPDNHLYALDTEEGYKEWSFEADGGIISSPAVTEDETIYFGTDNSGLYALDDEGELKWSYPTGGAINSSPNVDEDGNIYFGSSEGHLYSLDQTGDLNWRVELDTWVWSSPALGEDDIVYVGSGDGTLYAIDREDGSEVWNYSTEGDIYSSPAIGEDGTIYFGSYDGKLYALDQDGSLEWDHEIGSKIHPSPVIGEDGTVYIGSHDGTFHALDEGDLLWTFETSDRISSSAAISSDGIIYFGSEEGSFYALDPDGNERWSHQTGERESDTYDLGYYESGGAIYSSPAIGEDGRVFINSHDGNMYSFTGSDVDLDVSMEKSREVEMSVRIAGRWGNKITASVHRDDEDLGTLEVKREPGRPQEENLTFKYQEDLNHSLTLEFEDEYKGANPVWIRFNSGDRTTTIFEVFTHLDDDENVRDHDLTEEIGEMISRVREVHFSARLEPGGDHVSSIDWEFGDGETDSGKDVVHTYSSAGEYMVNLTVTLDNGDQMIVQEILIIEGEEDRWSCIYDLIQDMLDKDNHPRNRGQIQIPK